MPLSVSSLYSTSTIVSGTAGSFTTGSFTPANNSLLVVACSVTDGATTYTGSTLSISGGGLTWTPQKGLAGTTSGWSCESRIWTAPVTTGSSMTVTISNNFKNAGGVEVLQVTGYNTSTPIGATGSLDTSSLGGLTNVTYNLSATPASTSYLYSVSGRTVNSGGQGVTAGASWTRSGNANASGDSTMAWGTEYITGTTSSTITWANIDAGDTYAAFGGASVAVEILAAAGGNNTPADCSMVFQASANLRHPATLDTNLPRDNMFAAWNPRPVPQQLAFWFQPLFLGPTPKSTQNTNQPFYISPPEPKTPTAFWLKPPAFDVQRHVPTIYTAQSFQCNPTIGPPFPTGWYAQAPNLLKHPNTLDTNQSLADTFAGWNNNITPVALGFWTQPNNLLRHPATLDTNQPNAVQQPASTSTQTVVFFTTTGGQSWVVPAGVTSITVEGIGGGQGGGNASTNLGGFGGIAGDYAQSVLTVTPGQTIFLSVGVGGATNGGLGGDSWVNKSANSIPATSANGIIAIAAGSSNSDIGTLTYVGGQGGTTSQSGNPSDGSGGGGAAGPLGVGGNGVNGTTSAAGAGGAANNGTVAGGTTPSGNGNNGTSWIQTSDNATAGSGSGGAGGASGSTSGGIGGHYGGAGGGGAWTGSAGSGSAGYQGIVVISYIAAAVSTPADCSFLFQPNALLNHPQTLDTNQQKDNFFSGWANTTPTSFGFFTQAPDLLRHPATVDTNQQSVSYQDQATPASLAFWKQSDDLLHHPATVNTNQAFDAGFAGQANVTPNSLGFWTQAPDLLRHPNTIDTNQPLDDTFAGWTNLTPAQFGFWTQAPALIQHPSTIDTRQQFEFSPPTPALTPADCSFLFQPSESLHHPATVDTNQPLDDAFFGWAQNITPTALGFWTQAPDLLKHPATVDTNQAFVFNPPPPAGTPADCSFLFQPSALLRHPSTLDTNQPLDDAFAGWTGARATPTALGFWTQAPNLLRHPNTIDTNQSRVSYQDKATPSSLAFWTQPPDLFKHPVTLDTNQPVDDTFVGWTIPTPTQLGFWTQAPDLLRHAVTLDTNQPKDNMFSGWAQNITPVSFGFFVQAQNLLRHANTIDTNQAFVFNPPAPALTPANCAMVFQPSALLRHPATLDTNQPLDDAFAGWTGARATPTALGFWTQAPNLLRHPIPSILGGQYSFVILPPKATGNAIIKVYFFN